MLTSGRTLRWATGRRAEDRVLVTTVLPDGVPHWELQPRDGDEVAPAATGRRRDALLRRGLALADVVAALAALEIVTRVVYPGRVQLQPATVLVVVIVLLAGKLIGIYDRDQNLLRKTTMDEVPSLTYLSVVYVLAVWLLEAVLLNGWLGRAQVFALVVVMFGLTALGRLAVRRLALALTVPERCAVVGDSAVAARIAETLVGAPSVNATVVGRVELGAEAERADDGVVPSLGDFGTLARIVGEHHVERVIIAAQADGQDEILDAIRLVKALGIKVSVLPRLLEVVGSTSTFDEVDGLWLIGVRQFGLERSSELIKRVADICAACLILFVLGPLFVVLTIAIKLDSPGPVFFRQYRIGRRGERFWMLKFRSMVADAEARKAELRARNEAEGGLFKIADDPRITRVGKLLRRTSLDELPQLLNVLRGDMSLVGPRPLVPDEDSLITGWQRRRLAVKPGMTGPWQVFGSSRIPMAEMVKIDYLYGANWSLWLDLRILLRTIPYVLSRRGQ